jgi:hypothetical protein
MNTINTNEQRVGLRKFVFIRVHWWPRGFYVQI